MKKIQKLNREQKLIREIQAKIQKEKNIQENNKKKKEKS